MTTEVEELEPKIFENTFDGKPVYRQTRTRIEDDKKKIVIEIKHEALIPEDEVERNLRELRLETKLHLRAQERGLYNAAKCYQIPRSSYIDRNDFLKHMAHHDVHKESDLKRLDPEVLKVALKVFGSLDALVNEMEEATEERFKK